MSRNVSFLAKYHLYRINVIVLNRPKTFRAKNISSTFFVWSLEILVRGVVVTSHITKSKRQHGNKHACSCFSHHSVTLNSSWTNALARIF